MSKKKKNKQTRAERKASKQNPANSSSSSAEKISKKKQAKLIKKQRRHQKLSNVTTTDIIPVHSEKTAETETTFSKKLEEVINTTEQEGKKKGFFGNKVILLNAPDDTATPGKWKRVKANIVKGTVHFSLVFLALALASSAVVVIEMISSARILPRIALASVDLGYLQLEEAKQKLQQAIEKFNSTPLTFSLTSASGEAQNIEIPLADLKIELSTEQTFSNLPKFDFNNSNFTTLIASTVSEKTLHPAYQYDLDSLQDRLEEKFALTGQRASNASFFFDEKKNMQIKPEQAGQVIDLVKLKQDVENNLNNLDSSTIQISLIAELPEVNSAELEAYKADLLVKIESPLTLKYNNQSWTLNLKEHLNGLDFEKVEGQIMLALNDKFFDEYFQNEIFSKIEVPVSNVRIFYDDQQQIQFEGIARNGISVKKDDFRNLLEASINTLDTEVQIPAEETKGAVDAPADLQEKGIKELISVGHTAFAGSTNNRRHNIQTAMNRYQGQLIAPGQTYSFNERLGEVDGSTGYKLELVIKSEGTVPEYGGGVCQVSSTVFKAALLSGLKIDERSPHSYAVGYYAQIDGYGLDATIYPGVKDLIFTNNTPGYILIQSSVEGDHAYVNFYGTSDGRQVRLANYWKGNNRGTGGTQLIPTKTLPPGARKQVEVAHAGFDASWDRITIDKDGVETTENIYSVYRATANKILVGEE